MAHALQPGTDGADITVRITGPGHLGHGIGRVDGRVCMVPLTAVGDLVRAKITGDHKTWFSAAPVEIIEEGPGRTPPFCAVYGRCGGCHLQHLSDETRAAWKLAVFGDLMQRIGRIVIPQVEYVGSGAAGWRCRVGLHYDGSARDAGFFQTSSHRIVPPGRCPAAMDHLAGLLEPVREALRSTGWRESAEVELVTGADGRCVAVVSGDNRRPEQLHVAIEGVNGVNGVISRGRGTGWHATGDETVAWPTAGRPGQVLRTRVDPRGFTQAHMALNPFLVETVLRHAGPLEKKTVVELYGGSGNITLPMAIRGARVFSTDINGPAVAVAYEACAREGFPVCTAAGTTASVLAAIPADFRRPDVVVADPPRTGMGSDAAAIASVKANRAVICSCEPSGLARDLRAFVALGWVVESATVVDMFPSTYHMEAVISLTFSR